MPRVPFSNSSNSFAIAEGRPSTRAMPSPEVDDSADLFAAGRVGRVVLDESVQGVPDLLWTDREFCHRLSFLLSYLVVVLWMSSGLSG